MTIVKAPIETVLKAGLAAAIFRGVEERDGKNPTTGEPSTYWQWSFGVNTKQGEKEIRGNSSTNFGKAAKARQWAEAILGQPIKAGTELDLDRLIGMPCQLVLSIKEVDKVGPVNRVDNVVAVATEDAEEDGETPF